jgi:hypothetical protein
MACFSLADIPWLRFTVDVTSFSYMGEAKECITWHHHLLNSDSSVFSSMTASSMLQMYGHLSATMSNVSKYKIQPKRR